MHCSLGYELSYRRQLPNISENNFPIFGDNSAATENQDLNFLNDDPASFRPFGKDILIRECQDDGTWSEPEPTCRRAKCRPPPQIKDGLLELVDVNVGDKAR